jgi:hypothetical protein
MSECERERPPYPYFFLLTSEPALVSDLWSANTLRDVRKVYQEFNTILGVSICCHLVSESCLQSSPRNALERVRSLASHPTNSSLFATAHESDLLRASYFPSEERLEKRDIPYCLPL